MRARTITYWITTALLAFELILGGFWDLFRVPYVRHVLAALGYPMYLLTILGVWKLLAAAAILAPRFQRLKEWAYAGVFFEMTGAAASHAAAGNSPSALIAPLFITALAVASWALRPSARTLGSLFTGKEV